MPLAAASAPSRPRDEIVIPKVQKIERHQSGEAAANLDTIFSFF
jgi:hypothetical protein